MSSEIVRECLDNATGSHLIPLLWYAGENSARIEEEMKAIHQAGIREFILENRGGNWFCTDPWWKIFSFTLEKAREMGMRVWLLDDSHVNTGSANDSLKREENARFRPQNLRIEIMDLAGPLDGEGALLPKHSARESILRIVAFRRDEHTGVCYGEAVDLTENVKDGICLLDLPEGLWRIYFILRADPSLQGFFAHYITMVSKESCRHLIDEVHEKIYAHFAPYFGNTFAGFFSDEPAFGNCCGEYNQDMADLRTGQLDRLYCWWDDFPQRLAEKTGMSVREVWLSLPALWDNVEGASASLRLAYMDLITALWRENYSCQLGKWCEEHHVAYIGHNLEDEGCHMRMGWGCGHYFRSVAGQHMAGIDIVLSQLIPGITTVNHMLNAGTRVKKTKFYQYTLGRLASSMAHITPAMEKRSVCEVFGAYGWTGGLSVMRALLNHFLADGINNYIPHAFSMIAPEAFQRTLDRKQEKDSFVPPGYCMSYLPPNFYAGGFNPQYPAFCELMKYAQRVCRLLASGTHCADAALYYPAEVDWMNCGFEQDLDDVTATLTRGGVDFDLLPGDTLLADARVENGVLHVADETYRALIAPHGEVYPEALLRRFEAFADAGLPVIFCDALPERCERPGTDLSGLSGSFRVVPLPEVPGIVKADGKSMFAVTPLIPELRTFAWKLPDGTSCCILMNESRSNVKFSIRCREEAACTIYDPWKNILSRGTSSENGCAVRLDPQQLLVAIFGTDCGELPEYEAELPVMHELALRYDISIREAGSSAPFRMLRRNSEPVNLLKEENLTRFCGELLYESTFECDDQAFFRHLAIPRCGDCAELWLNDEYCGMEIGPVCRFDIRGKLRKGKNRIRIRTASNPAYVDRNPEKALYGTALPLCRHGFTGNILIG